MATKKDIAEIEAKMATKDDIAELPYILDKQYWKTAEAWYS